MMIQTLIIILTTVIMMMMIKKSTESKHFNLGAASTPYYGGEQYEMRTMQHEQSGLPSYDEETPLLRVGSIEDIERRLIALRNPTTGLLEVTKIHPRENPFK